MPRVKQVRSARIEHVCSYCFKAIPIGKEYFWWKHKLRRGGLVKKRCKVCGYPKRYMLTLSPFYMDLWTAEDAFDPQWASDLTGAVEELAGALESLKEMCEDSLENMPEALQDSSESGMLLQERIDGLESWIGALESMDTDVPDELQTLDQEEAASLEEDLEEWLAEKVEEAMVENQF